MVEIAEAYNTSCVYNGVDLYGFKEDEFILISELADESWFESDDGKFAMDEILESETRIIISMTPFNDYLFKLWVYLYDQGYRRGDFVFIATA